MATVKVYQETDNEGMSKPERFMTIEKHLIELTSAINSLESKVNDKSSDNKKNCEEDIKKLKADFLNLKTQDLEKIKSDIRDLSVAVKKLQPPPTH
jgi:hypothetical protein